MVGARGSERAARVEQGRPGRERILSHLGAGPGERQPAGAGEFRDRRGGRTLWAELRDDGVIAATTFPQGNRTVDEFTAPFADPGVPVRQAGPELEYVETRVVRCLFAVAFGEHGDAARFAHEYTPTLRSWSEATLAAGLAAPRSEAERRAILDRFYDLYERRVSSAPVGHAKDYVHCYLVAAKS